MLEVVDNGEGKALCFQRFQRYTTKIFTAFGCLPDEECHQRHSDNDEAQDRNEDFTANSHGSGP